MAYRECFYFGLGLKQFIFLVSKKNEGKTKIKAMKGTIPYELYKVDKLNYMQLYFLHFPQQQKKKENQNKRNPVSVDK